MAALPARSRLSLFGRAERGRLHCVFNRPAARSHQSGAQDFFMHTGRTRQLDQRVLFAAVDEAVVGRSVVCLLALRRPTAVAGFVIPMVVRPAVERGSVRSLPHVGEEVVEGQPPVADRDAVLSVMRKGRVGRLLATAKHAPPRRVCRGWSAVAPAAVSVVKPCTPARHRVAADKRSALDDGGVPAVALTAPSDMSARTNCRQRRYCGQLAELHAKEIFGGGHDVLPISLSATYHFATTIATNGAL